MSTQETQVEAAAGESPAGMLMEISNEMVKLYKDQFGRGPTPGPTGRGRTR